MKLKPLVRLKHIGRQVKEGAKSYLTDSTALLTASTPLFAALEVNAAGMSNENSINARLLGAGLTFAGMGSLFIGGLRKSRKLFKVRQETSEKFKQLHDASYAVVYNMIIAPPFYLIAGVRDLEQIAVGTAISTGFGLIAGGPIGYAVDVFGDLTGTRSCSRAGYPELVRKQPSYIKKTIAAGLVAASLALTLGVYQINDYLKKPQSNAPVSQAIQPKVQENLELKIKP